MRQILNSFVADGEVVTGLVLGYGHRTQRIGADFVDGIGLYGLARTLEGELSMQMICE